jgi:hypothetical protein
MANPVGAIVNVQQVAPEHLAQHISLPDRGSRPHYRSIAGVPIAIRHSPEKRFRI